MEDGSRVRIDMGTTTRQRRNLLSPFNELAWASHGSRSANGQGIEDRLVLKYWKRSLSSRYDRPSVPYPTRGRQRLIPSIEPYYPLSLADSF